MFLKLYWVHFGVWVRYLYVQFNTTHNSQVPIMKEESIKAIKGCSFLLAHVSTIRKQLIHN